MRTTNAIVLFLTLAGGLATSRSLAAPAHDDGGAHHDRENADWEEEAEGRPPHMRMQILDRLPPENLSVLGFTACVGGFAGGFPCQNVDLMALLPLNTIGGGTGNDCWGWTDSVTGMRVALMGRSSGTSFVDITIPESPIYLGNLPTHTVNSTWRGIKVYNDHAYIISEASGHGMQIFDLRQLRNVTNPPVQFTETAHYPGFGNAHTINVNEETGFLYPVGSQTCSGGLHMINAQSPAAPVFAGCVSSDGYTHETQCVVYHGPDAAHVGKEICFNSNEDTLTIVDVTVKSAPVQLSRTPYAGEGYTHQGWLTPDHRFFLLDDELDEQQFGHNSRTRIWDVANLDAPFVFSWFDGTTPAIDHNLYVHDGHVYEANYRAGLRVLDATNVATGQLSEVGYFDIYPINNNPNFNGAWSVYPFFGDGIVIVGGIEQGLFVLRTTINADFGLDATAETIEICDPGQGSTSIALQPINGYSGNVTLSAQSLPSGASAGFSVNPVPVPGSSTMTITTSGLGWGNYTFDVRGTDGPRTHEQTLGLSVAGEPAGQTVLADPPDGATGVPRQPVLSWGAVFPVTSYFVEVASDPEFATIVFSSAAAGTSLSVTALLDFDRVYYWRVTATNPCGTTGPSAASSFRTQAHPPILVVDDDDNSPDVRSFYTTALDGLGLDYEIWNTNGSDTEPDAVALAPYRTVLWTTGDSIAASSGPGVAGETALATWLDGGGCLLVASQDFLQVRGLTPFAQSYLGIGTFTNNVTQVTVKGHAPAFFGLGPYNLSFPYANRTDIVSPASGVEVAFDGSTGDAGVAKDAAWYRTTFWGFGLEALSSAAARQETLQRVVAWCQSLADVDGDGDGVTNGQDCSPSSDAVWAVPSPARDLRLQGAAATQLVWTPPSTPGADAVTYDVIRSVTPEDFGVGVCVESAGLDTQATDTAVPAADGLFSYLVRVTNGCGSNLGTRSDGVPRTGAICP